MKAAANDNPACGYIVNGDTVTLFANHPYFDCFWPWVVERAWGWECRYRDFWTALQDCEYRSKEDAERAANRIAIKMFETPITIDFEGGQEDLERADAFWREIAPTLRRITVVVDQSATGEPDGFYERPICKSYDLAKLAKEADNVIRIEDAETGERLWPMLSVVQ